MAVDFLCAVCGHPKSEHGLLQEFLLIQVNRQEVCAMCDGWGEAELYERVTKPARHRFKLKEDGDVYR